MQGLAVAQSVLQPGFRACAQPVTVSFISLQIQANGVLFSTYSRLLSVTYYNLEFNILLTVFDITF